MIGTTGFNDQELALIENSGKKAKIIRAGNMSLGVNLLVQLTKKVAATLDSDFDIEIIETHHNKKVDAPSGTALMLGNAAADGRQISLSNARDSGRDGITGARNRGDIGFVSIRGGDVRRARCIICSGWRKNYFTPCSYESRYFCQGCT